MRSEAWRPAAAACNRLPREARDPARQALRPGCEELAARIRRQLPAVVGRRAPKETEARPRGQNRHGGAPRGERPASWDARRLARRLAYRVMIRPTGVPPSTRTFLGAPPTPRFGVSEAKVQTPGAEMRRGNEEVCVVDDVVTGSNECGRSYCALSPCGRRRLDVAARDDG